MRPTVPDGLVAKTSHLRVVPGLEELLTRQAIRDRGVTAATMGGMTIVHLLRDGEVVAEGVAKCRPDENFNRRIGRDAALGRALKALGGS